MKTITLIVIAVLIGTSSRGANSFDLITKEEAERPPLTAKARGGMALGPVVELRRPLPDDKIKSPLNILIDLTPRGGTKLDPSIPIRLIYWRQGRPDLTNRI